MGIGWLWHYTDRSGDEPLRADNERRAAAIYGRWRMLHALVDDAARRALDQWSDARRRRAGLRELAALSDQLLDDVGLLRDGSTGLRYPLFRSLSDATRTGSAHVLIGYRP